MEHYTIAHNAWKALVAALLMVVILAAPAAGRGESHKHKQKPTLKGKQEQYVEITYYANVTIGLDGFFVLPPLAVPATSTGFGAVIVVDSVITSGLDPSSPSLGTAKGFYILDNINNATGQGLELVATIIFNDASGFGAGSTISYRGFAQLNLPVREVSITGGTGKFRLARGWADVSTPRGGGASSEYNFVNHIFYYDI